MLRVMKDDWWGKRCVQCGVNRPFWSLEVCAECACILRRAGITFLLETIARDPQEAQAWLNTPHPQLDNLSPMELIRSGRTSAVVTLLENGRGGIPS